MDRQPSVVLVDDDPVVLESISALLGSVGLAVKAFQDPKELLESDLPRPGCVVLDLRMPGMGGLEVFERLRERWSDLTAIFLTGHGEITTAVQAMKGGARDFLEKPFSHQALLGKVQEALAADEQVQEERADRAEVEARLGSLTAREKTVLELIVQGLSSKMIAAELGISTKTVEAHRTGAMSKMNARNAAELVRLAVTAGLSPEVRK